MLRLLVALCLCAFGVTLALPAVAAVDPQGAVEMRHTAQPRLAPVHPVARLRPVTLAQQLQSAPGTRFSPDDAVDGTPAQATAGSREGQMRWLRVREGPVPMLGGIALAALLVFLLMFRVVRGRVRIAAGRSGRTMPRYNIVERTVHWLLAGSFIVLAISGLFISLGREFLVPMMDAALYGTVEHTARWLHRGVWWLFAISLVLMFILFLRHSLPMPRDLRWWRRGGPLHRKGVQLDAGKFDGGQKAVFWATVILGGLLCATGISLLFPFKVELFGALARLFNGTGIPGLLGGPVDTAFATYEEVQLAQVWHAILAFLLTAVALAHGYMRSLGMEGAAEAMYAGTVDENFARERSNLWAEARRGKALAADRSGTAGNPPR